MYDSGCFHHIAPHPRITDLEVVTSGDTFTADFLNAAVFAAN